MKMKTEYSLVHLTNINATPPEMIYTAAKTGYDAVSLRTIPMGLAGEIPHDIARDKQLMLKTKAALKDTGIRINDIENARIAEEADINAYASSLEAAAELGVNKILTNIWVPDKTYYTEKFCQLCELAQEYGQSVFVEFVTWASVTDLKQAKELLLTSGMDNVGIVVDTLHFHRSRVSVEELDGLPSDWFKFAHLCDASNEIPTDINELIHTGRAERLYLGEGAININEILDHLPAVVCGLEVPHLARVKELGFEEHARRALQCAKKYMEDSAAKGCD